MKTRLHTRDLQEDRFQRAEKLGVPAETLPAKTRADHTRYATRVRQPAKDLPLKQKIPKAASRDATTEAAPEPHRVSFRLKSPDAHLVFVAGTFNDWNPLALPRTRDAFGEWSVELPLSPGKYEYRFIVDGLWQEDPCASLRVSNPFGMSNSVLLVA